MPFSLLVAVVVIRVMREVMIVIVQVKDDHHQDGHQNDFEDDHGHHQYDQYCDLHGNMEWITIVVGHSM